MNKGSLQQQINNKADMQMVGTPLVAASASAMTDTTKIYVYTGSETGYTAGNWYYYNGSTWVSGGVYNSIALETDTTLSISGAAADAKITGDKTTDLKNALDIYAISPLYKWRIGKNYSSAGVLQNNTSIAITNMILVSGGDIIVNTTPEKDSNQNNLWFYVNQFEGSVWKSRTTLSSGNSITLSSVTTGVVIGYGRSGSAGIDMTQEDIDTYFSMKMYSKGRYIVTYTGLSGNSFLNNTDIGFYNIAPADYNAMTDKPDVTFGGGTLMVYPAGSDPNSRLQLLYDIINKQMIARYVYYSETTYTYTAYDWMYVDYSFSDFAKSRTPSTGTLLSENTAIGFYHIGSYAQAPTSGYVDMPISNFGGGTLEVVPAGGSNGIKQILTDVTTGYKWDRYISGSTLQNIGEWNAAFGIKWCAIGDSITYGVYSTGAETTSVNQNKCYAKRVANAIGAQIFDNKGVRGLGFVHAGNNSESLKTDVIDATTWTNYNLITVALGINDYYGVSQIGTESSTAWNNTVYGNVRGTIESIMSANPNAKLIFITPFNMSKYGSSSTHWGKDFSRNNIGTLNAVKNAIIYWCDFYGIEYINETDYGPINDLNIQTLLLDGLHPTSIGHELIARELVRKINFS